MKKIENFDIQGDVAVSVKDMNLYYGTFHALKNINGISRTQAHGNDRPFGLR